MKELFIHIGTPKTGTSYLQRFLKKNAEKLKNKGIYYPCSPNKLYYPPPEQHVSLISSITGHRVSWLDPKYHFPNGEALKQLLEDLEFIEQDKVLISSEVFYDVFVNKEMILKLKNAFSNFHVKIIVYLRRQDEYLLSYFQQNCKSGTETSFDFEKMFSYLEDNMNYYKRLTMWGDVIGKENIIVRPFEINQMKNRDLAHDFLSAIGINDISDFENVERINESISLEKLFFLMKLNKHLYSFSGNEDWNTRFLHQKIREQIINMKNILEKGDIGQLLTKEKRGFILCKYYEGNKKIAQEFLGRQDGVLFKEDLIQENNSNNITLLSEDSEFQAIASLLIDAQKKLINNSVS